MLTRHFIVSLFFICFVKYVSAADNPPSYITYIKNQGQWNSPELYRADFRGGRLFLEKNAITYLFYPQDGLTRLHPHDRANKAGRTIQTKKEDIILDFHAVHMEFTGSSDLATITALNNKSFYHNYYKGKDAKKWISNVPLSEGVTYNNLYEGVSLKAFSANNNFRYDFIVNPMADASVIKMKFTGQDKLSLQDGKLIISTSVGNMIQQAPYVYQLEDGKEQQVNCRYTLRDNIVGIEITGEYNHNIPLIIDPTLVFATFTGSTADNWGMSASYDSQGNGYTSGICFDTGYPLTTGAFQQTFNNGTPDPSLGEGGFDIVVSKFNASGSSLLFSTYLGGTGNEAPESIIVDKANNLLVLGHSYSTDFPVTAGAYDISQNGGADIIITKFNPNGTALLASTFIGGSGDDGVNYSDEDDILGSLKYNYADNGRGDIILDNSDNVYIASCTESTNFPVTPGCVQAISKGLQDGCVFKLNPALTSLNWSTYLGGNANDAAYNLAIDNNSSVYVTGGTESTDLPVSSGALHASYGGNIDGFLTHISSGGNTILQSTYIGTSGYDQSYFVQLDNANNVYIFGQTSGSYPITAGVYSNANSGQFIHAFNSTLSTTLFSTEFGTGKGTPDIVPSAFLVDKCNNIYISGWGGTLDQFNNSTSSTTGMPITPNAIQPGTDGMDFYFMVLQKNASALWYASFFGGDNGSQEHVDGGTSRFDKSGVIYQAICEGCAVSASTNWQPNSDMPTTPSAWSTTNKSNNCNNALVKYKFDLNQTIAVLSTNPTSTGCAPFTANFTNQSTNAIHYHWYFGDGNTSASVNTSHTYTTPGTYTITLIAIDSSTCNMMDTTYAVVTVNPSPILSINSPTICAGTTTTLTANGASTYVWNTFATSASIIESPTSTTQYTVTGVSSGTNTCKSTATTTITVNPRPKIIVPSTAICVGNTTTLTASGASTYSWNTSATSPSIVQSPTITTNYTVTATDSNSCVNTTTVSIKVNPLPIVSINSQTICAGTSGLLIANGASTYTWNTTDIGAIISPSPTVATNYTVTGKDINGCINTATASISVNPAPTISVSSSTICAGNTATLTVSGASSYTWSTNATTASIVISPTVTSYYNVSSTNGICVSSKVATVVVLINHTKIIGTGTLSVCAGDSIKLKTYGIYASYQWNTGQNTPTIEVSHAGMYIVHTIDTIGCKGIDSVTVFEDSPVIISLHDTTICNGENAQLHTVSGYYTYQWIPAFSLNKDNIYNPVAHPTTNTTYTLTITNGACINTNTLTVFVNPSPKVTVKPNYSLVLAGESVILHASSSDSCSWYPSTWLSCSNNCNTSISTPDNDVTYTITTTNSEGCSTSTTATIQVQAETTFYIPNTFTPNNDGRNETFKPAYTNIYNYKILIYDRWGLLLFQSNNPDDGWDGTYKGGVCQQDVYVYKAEYKDGVTFNFHSLSGHVNLIR